jgi:hypothetical protein
MSDEGKTVWRERGIYFFTGRVRCPMAGLGSRGDFESNRVTLDNADTTVTLDRQAKQITVDNRVDYPQRSIIADLTFLAEGVHRGGGRSPFAIHLKIFKYKNQLSIDLHRHLRSQEEMVDVEVEPFEVVATDGSARHVLLNREKIQRLCQKPSLALRVVKSLMATRNNIDGLSQDPSAAGFRVADLSLGFGTRRLAWMMCRASLSSTSSDNAALIRGGDVHEMLREGAWEMKLTVHTDKYLPEVVKRDLFLFGLDELPLLSQARAQGLRKGQSLSFRFHRGAGEVGLDDQSAPLPGALDVARAYIEFHMLGGLLAEEAERVAAQHKAKPLGAPAPHQG